MARLGKGIHNGTCMELSVPNRRTIGHSPELCTFSPPVKRHVINLKTYHRRENVKEVLRHITVLVKYTAKKLQATNDCLHPERLDDTTEHPDDTAAEMASDIISKFEYLTSLHSVCVTVIIICF